MRTFDPVSLYYITHTNNLPSILEKGILSHVKIEELDVSSTPIYNIDIVRKRKDKTTPDGKSLWDYANLYFQPRNPMMYCLIHEKEKEDLVVVGVSKGVLHEQAVVITDGNAANDPTQFYSQSEGLAALQKQQTIIQNDWWNEIDGSKRKIMAECLVPGQVNPEYIHTLYVANDEARKHVERVVRNLQTPVVPEPHMFFQPKFKSQIGDNISLINGDMFFSTMQTLTISVNLQGVMGKGLASRAKYQFPDVYVTYEDACRAKTIRARQPYLYKRETSLNQELADPSLPLSTPNAVKWFLLFATNEGGGKTRAWTILKAGWIG